MPGAPWSYGLLILAVLVAIAVAWQYFARRMKTKKAGPRTPLASDEQIVERLTGNACKLLQRLGAAQGKPREFQTLGTVLAGQQDYEQATQQALDLLTSDGCAARVGKSQYRITPRGIRVGDIIKAAKKK